MKNDVIISNHPYEPYIPNEATKLIIGSIPPQRFCINPLNLEDDDVRFYYGSRDNHFWKLIGEVTKENFIYENKEEAIDQRKKWLEKNKIGITDIVDICEHINGKSDDNSLNIIKFKEIENELKNHPEIKTLICTSSFVKNHLTKLLKEKMNAKYHKDSHDQRKGYISINEKEAYEVIILYSPSRLALRGMGPNGKEIRKKQYENVFKK